MFLCRVKNIALIFTKCALLHRAMVALLLESSSNEIRLVEMCKGLRCFQLQENRWNFYF